MKRARGFTIVETIVVALILGMMLTAIVGAIPPLFSSPDRAAAKVDSITPAAGLYAFERDLRESDASAIFACAGSPPACGDGGVGGGESVLVIATAYASADEGAQFQTSGMTPDWQGFIVYRRSQSSQIVYRSFEPAPGLASFIEANPPNRAVLQTLAEDAAAQAAIDPAAAIALRGVFTLSAAIDPVSGLTTLHVVTIGSAGGHENTSTFDDDVFARN